MVQVQSFEAELSEFATGGKGRLGAFVPGVIKAPQVVESSPENGRRFKSHE
jgi:hypothetical protein